MKKIMILIAIILFAIPIIGVLTGQTKLRLSDFFFTGDELYEDIYEAYENYVGESIDDEDKIATFDFDNFAFIIHYYVDGFIQVDYFEKENDMYRYSGKGFGTEYIDNEFGGHPYSYNGSSIELDIVSSDAKIPEGYTSEIIKLKNGNALFVYKVD